jgi:hypothetical protein
METIKEIKNDLSYETHKKYKLIILIIATNGDCYSEFTRYWKQYMNKFPDVRCFFLYSDPSIDYDIVIDDDKITHRFQEWYEPGILYKTIAGMFIAKNFFKCDYILRTNLSSFIHIPRLLTFLEKQPRQNYAAAKQSTYREGIGFLSGAGFILSADVINEVLDQVFNKKCTENPEINMAPDDVAITMILKRFIKLDRLYELPRYDCDDLIDPNIIPDDVFHIRNKTEWKYQNRDFDIKNMKTLVDHFYN